MLPLSFLFDTFIFNAHVCKCVHSNRLFKLDAIHSLCVYLALCILFPIQLENNGNNHGNNKNQNALDYECEHERACNACANVYTV